MQIDVTTFETLTRLAQQYGPFLFALLFILVVTRTAHEYYQECNTRTQPRASESEKKTYRSYFISSVWVGIALMLISIGWWIYAQMQGPSIYQIAIVGLRPEESVLSDYYSKTISRPSIPGAMALHDTYFIVAREGPIAIGDEFNLYYFKAATSAGAAASDAAAGVGIAGVKLDIKYFGRKRDAYQVAQSDGGPSLKIVEASLAMPGWQFADTAVMPSEGSD
jgi:hypothetical protein